MGNWPKFLGGFSDTAEYVGKFVNQLKGDDYLPALKRCRDTFDTVDVDRLRVKPIVKITGEFWAQTTEGDGNFNMFHFLEREGAQVLVEPIGTWIMYMIHQVVQKYKDLKGLEEGAVLPPIWKVGTARENRARLPPEGGEAQAGRSHLQERIPQDRGRAGRHCAPPGRPVRAAAPGPPLLQLARGRRRRPPGSRQEHLLLEQRPGAHGAVAQAVRLHARPRSPTARNPRWSPTTRT